MGWRIQRFQELRKDWGVKVALWHVWYYINDHVRNPIYGKTGLDDFIRNQLLVGGRGSILDIFWVFYVKLYQPILERKIGTGIHIMDEDWDNLILLDAYRADYFKEYSSLDGELSTVVSKANHSHEFVVKNFKNKQYHDTVLITSNVWYQKSPYINDSTFHAAINPVGIESPTETNPELVTEAAIDAIERFPNKRFIVHYMSPHTPHIGDTSDHFRDKIGDDFSDMCNLYRQGKVSKDQLERSYIETIRFIEDEIQELLEDLEGKTVISSDHGENLGEKQHGMTLLNHGNPSPECRYVPWLEMDFESRKEITEDPPVGFENLDDEVVGKRLKALGYK